MKKASFKSVKRTIYISSKSIWTSSEAGWDWHVRIKPLAISSSEREKFWSIVTDPLITLALQTQQTPPLQENGTSAPSCIAASRIEEPLEESEKLKSSPSTQTETELKISLPRWC